MKKLIIIVVSVCLLALFFVFNPLHYNLTEERMNRYLIERADSQKFNRDIEIPNVAKINIKLSDMTVEVGRREPNLVKFNAQANLRFDSVFGDKNTVLTFSVSAAPYFDKEKKAVYVKSIEILSATTESSRVNLAMPLIEPILTEALSRYFEDHPVYQLNPGKRFKEWIAYHYGTGISVKPGAVTIYLGK